MKPIVSAGVVAVCLLLTAVAPVAQNKADLLKNYSRVIENVDVALTVVHVNSVTAPILFQPPTLYAMRARAAETTVLYVQGKADRDIEIDTTNFKIEQAGQNAVGVPTNIKNFAKGSKVRVPLGGQIDGVLVFPKLFDVSKAFTLRHDRDLIEFKFNAEQVKALTAPAPAAPQ